MAISKMIRNGALVLFISSIFLDPKGLGMLKVRLFAGGLRVASGSFQHENMEKIRL